MAHQAAHPELAEPAHRVVEIDRCRRRSARVVPSISSPWTPGEVGQAVGGLRELGGDRRAGHAAQLVQRAALLGPAGADDAHPVAERLDLGEDVARQQHGAPLGLDLADAVLEHGLHERIEARRRLVEDQQLGAATRARRRGRPSVGCPSSRCGPSWSGRARSARAARRAAGVEVAAQPAEQVDHLAAAELRPQGDVARHVREPAVQRDGVAPRIAAEQRRPSPRSARSSPSRTRIVVVLPDAVRARGTRAPRPSRPRGRGRRGPASARTS